MRFKVISCITFAALMFLIPMIAMERQQISSPSDPLENSAVQVDGQKPAPQTDSGAQEKQQPQSESGQTSEKTKPPSSVVDLEDDGFRILDERTGKVFTVSAQEYVRGSLAAEMPPNFHPEALKAQAVAAHTYALNLKNIRRTNPDPDLKGADLSADPQNWKSYTTEEVFRERYGEYADAYWKTICEAADSVESYVLTYEEEPIVAAYHSMSNGETEDAANVWIAGKPYLIPVESFGDTLAPDFSTTETFSVEEVGSILRAAYPNIQLEDDPTQWLQVISHSDSGYVTGVSAGDIEIEGKELRSLLGLRSADFSVNCDGGSFTFQVKGYGHGVGLSQYGADYMARQGSTFDEILLHYYPGTTLAIISQ